MRKILAAAIFGLVLGVAGASNPDDQAPEGRAYLGFSFGGERATPRDFHYGLRLDHDSRYIEGEQVSPLMQLDFTRAGLNAARINGVNVVRQQYRLHQAEEAPAEAAEGAAEAAPAEEKGFFSRTWNKVKGVFSGGEEAPAEETVATEPAAAAGEEVTEGMFLNFNAVDWGLLAVGAVGLGFAVGEVSNGDESPGAGGGTTGSPTGPAPTGCTGTTGQTGLPCIPTPYLPAHSILDVHAQDPEYQKWLDGGTGQMGDLGG